MKFLLDVRHIWFWLGLSEFQSGGVVLISVLKTMNWDWKGWRRSTREMGIACNHLSLTLQFLHAPFHFLHWILKIKLKKDLSHPHTPISWKTLNFSCRFFILLSIRWVTKLVQQWINGSDKEWIICVLFRGKCQRGSFLWLLCYRKQIRKEGLSHFIGLLLSLREPPFCFYFHRGPGNLEFVSITWWWE